MRRASSYVSSSVASRMKWKLKSESVDDSQDYERETRHDVEESDRGSEVGSVSKRSCLHLEQHETFYLDTQRIQKAPVILKCRTSFQGSESGFPNCT